MNVQVNNNSNLKKTLVKRTFVKKRTPGKPPIIKVFVLELLIINLLSLIVLTYSLEAAYSAMLGGLIASASSLAFALSAYRYTGAGAVQKMVKYFYQGEMLKMIVAALLFAAVFKWVNPVNVVALFFVFAIMLILNGFMPSCIARLTGK